MVITTDDFRMLSEESAATQGLPDARIACVAHPIGATTEAGLRARAESIVDTCIALLTGRVADRKSG